MKRPAEVQKHMEDESCFGLPTSVKDYILLLEQASAWRVVGNHFEDGETPMLIWDGSMMCTATCERMNGVHYKGTDEERPYNYLFWRGHGSSGWECEDDFEEPTHWLPLPTPPQTEDKANDA